MKIRGVIVSVVLLFLCVQTAAAQTDDYLRTRYQYAAKVTCSFLTPFQDGILAQGIYRTVVNLHNPTDETIVFATKVALAGDLGSDPSSFSVTPYQRFKLQPDGAVQVNCGTVAGFYCPLAGTGLCVDFAFFDGFVVINSPVELDVVSVYSARHSGASDEVETMDVERVEPVVIRSRIETVEKGSEEIRERVRYPGQGSNR